MKLHLGATLFAASLVVSTAWAVPQQLAHQGRLLDADAAPLEGEHDLTFTLFDAPEDGQEVWSETIEADLTGGFYSVVLGADEDGNTLDELVLAGGPLWLELRVDDSEPMRPRHKLLSVPYAVMAGTATNVEGGVVDASEIAVDGTTVIDAGGNWVGPAVDWSDLAGVPTGLDTLGGLSCADGGVAKYSSGLWACGTDDVLEAGDVLAFVDGATVALGTGSSMAGSTLATVADLDWALITSVPAGFADEVDDDTLATLGPSCLDGDRASWDATAAAWVCAPEDVALSRIDTAGATSGQVLTYDGTSVVWDTPASATNPPCTLDVLDEEMGGARIVCGASTAVLRTWMQFSQFDLGANHRCGVETVGGGIECWGVPTGSAQYGQVTDTPSSGAFTQVGVGHYHNCAIEQAGSVSCWGRNDFGQSTPPTGTAFTQVTAGLAFTCALDTSGTVACWGVDDGSGWDHGQVTGAPAGTFSQISAGASHVCGLRPSGIIECWGAAGNGRTAAPSGTFAQVSAGSAHTCALETSGAVLCWGLNNNGQATAPSGSSFSVVEASASGQHSCALDISGTATCWGQNASGESDPPARAFTSLGLGPGNTCGLLAELGVLTCWGAANTSMTFPP